MSSVQTWSDSTKRVYVEWNKHAPHWRMHQVLRIDANGISYTEMRGYHSEAAAIRAAKRIISKLEKDMT